MPSTLQQYPLPPLHQAWLEHALAHGDGFGRVTHNRDITNAWHALAGNHKTYEVLCELYYFFFNIIRYNIGLELLFILAVSYKSSGH